MKRSRLSPSWGSAWVAMLAAVLSCGLSSSWALVGETEGQIETRYGGPGKMIGDQVLYAKDEWNVSVFYSATGVVTMEIYTHRPDSGGTRPDLTQPEIDALLHDEGRGQAWGEGEADGLTTWRREDGRLFARYRPSDQLIVFISPDHQALAGRPAVLLKDGKTADVPAPANP